MAQKVSLNITNGETFKGGEKLLANDLADLGLDEQIDHMKITFDNAKTVKYSICGAFIFSLVTCVFWPFFILFYPCVAYGIRKWAESRIAAVTDSQLVLKQGYYGFCCICWNESTKSVPLDKITDLQVQQGCLQNCFGIKEIRVETASATSEMPEMRLIGLNDPLEIRSRVLNVRDHQKGKSSYYQAGSQPGSSNSYNPLMPPSKDESSELLKVIESQNETMSQIKDVLQDMRTALVSMNEKMEKGKTL